MVANFLKNEALILRKKGWSYSEIEEKIKVPKSTLSGWLSNIKLSTKHKIRLEEKMRANRKLGSVVLKNRRIEKTKLIIENAIKDVKGIEIKDLWLIGIVLYWAEGSKQKEHDPSKGVIFSNSDPAMIKVYLKWLDKCMELREDRIVFEIYIHETYQKTVKELSLYWSKITGFHVRKFDKVYFKKNKVHSFRRNRGIEYNGVLRISVIKSTDLNRKITGWTKGICRELGS